MYHTLQLAESNIIVLDFGFVQMDHYAKDGGQGWSVLHVFLP